MRNETWGALIERLESGLISLWHRALGWFSEPHRLTADLTAALEAGHGYTTLTWCWDEDQQESVDQMLASVGEVIRRSPSPIGVDELFIDVAVYGARPEDAELIEDTPEGRRLLHWEEIFVDRRDDWILGDTPSQLRRLLASHEPSHEAPLVAVGIMSIGGAMSALLRRGRWRPVSPWLR
jgi:hypothetical protein